MMPGTDDAIEHFGGWLSHAMGVSARRPVEALDAPDLEDQAPTFIERKRFDTGRLMDFLSLSASVNHWANFGPVSSGLARCLEVLLSLPPSRTVIMTSSGTTALVALIGVHTAAARRPLRWLASAYGFASTAIGPMKTCVRIIDCDDAGMLDLNAVEALDEDEWDGLLVTNLFGRYHDLGAYREFCLRRGKRLVVDNATALLGVDRRSHPIDEIISFHHTKPWGVGEGGCLVIDKNDADMARRLLSFGVGVPDVALPFAGNGKISDYACALILERLERLPVWRQHYQHQYARVRSLGARAGLQPFGDIASGGVTGNVPMLMPRAVFPQEVSQSILPLSKYYAPLSSTAPKAAALYGRMVNVACHPGIAALGDNLILEALSALHSVSSPTADQTSGFRA